MAPNVSFTTSAFKALQSNDERKVLDIVDKLRHNGLNGAIELPQLIVCGDQSSGKSSVLEAITEIPFPRKDNLCTRFATEIVLRRSPRNTVHVKINPDPGRPEQEQAKLRTIDADINHFDQLPEVIDRATNLMGLGKTTSTKSRGRSEFAKDSLSIEICGPDRPQLTLVDLPGLIHTTGKGQSAGDKQMVFDLVHKYMENPRTIILAIISCKNDWQNQVILEDCRKIDKEARRTLGIITKPDAIDDSDIRNWVDLAKNKHVFFERGWHVLKNRGPTEMEKTFTERNKSEKRYFNKGHFADLPENCLGIDALRERLSKLLLDHLIKELPHVREEITMKLKSTTFELDQMGEKRTTISEQRTVLTKISLEINHILSGAVNGNYDNAFFGSPDMDTSVDARENIRRFRAVVQYLNFQFSDAMRRQGHKFAIAPGLGDSEIEMAEAEEDQKALASMGDKDLGSCLPKPKAIDRKDAIAWVQMVLERSRGLELPGNFNPALISQLFWQQSKPWEDIATEHINQVAFQCKTFVHKVLQENTPAEFLNKLIDYSVEDALGEASQDAKDELSKLITDNERHPMTYNHLFTTNLQKQRQRKYTSIAQKAAKASETAVVYNGPPRAQIDPIKLEQEFAKSIEQNMDRFSAEEALDNMRAFYKEERQYFISAVVKTVIERHLVEPLPKIILNPVDIAQMSDEDVKKVAAEAPETTQRRKHLERHKAMLEKGLETFRDAMGGLKR